MYGAGVRCDRLRFSVNCPFIEKSMVSNTQIVQLEYVMEYVQ